MKTSEKRSNGGFTMVELMVVVVILAILAGIGVKVGAYVNQKQAVASSETQLALLEGALEQYQSTSGQFPEHPVSDGRNGTNKLHEVLFSDPVILAQLDPGNDRQDWLSEQGGGVMIIDPWGNEFRYRSNPMNSPVRHAANPGFDLWSCGPDGRTNAGPDGAYDPEDPLNRDDVRRW